MRFPGKYKASPGQLVVATGSLICFICFWFIVVSHSPAEPVWNSFSDHLDYLAQSKLSLWSPDFYITGRELGFSPRPFTVPLFYKMAGDNPQDIVLMQQIFYCFCVFIFVNASLSMIRRNLVKMLYLPVVYFFFTWWVIVGFSSNLLSESLSMSFLFLWLAALILVIRTMKWYTLVFLLLVSTLFSFTRDTWPYIILAANFLLFTVFIKGNKILRQYFLALSVYSLFVLLFQSYTAKAGERYRIPLYNVLSTRIAKNPAYLGWFKERGMPCSDSLVQKFCKVDPENFWSVIPLYDSYYNPYFDPLNKWIMHEGKNHYIWFMFTHPGYFFLCDQTDAEKSRIFETTDHYYAPAKGYFSQVGKAFPLFSLSFLVSMTALLCLLFFLLKNKNYWHFVPLFLVLIFTLNVLVSYNADTLEVVRHLFVTQVMVQLLSILCTAFACDGILQLFKERRTPIEPHALPHQEGFDLR